MIINKRIEVETISLYGTYPSNFNYHDAYKLTEDHIIGYRKNYILPSEAITDDILYTEEQVYDRDDIIKYIEID